MRTRLIRSAVRFLPSQTEGNSNKDNLAAPGGWRWQCITLATLAMLGISGMAYGQAAISRAAVITSIAYGGDGDVGTTTLDDPYALVVDSAGDVYFADELNDVVREVSFSGTMTVVAGTVGTACPTKTAACGDGGAATSAELDEPRGVALDGAGNLYIADYNDNRIREVNSATGIITTVAGTGTGNDTGNGGAATSATLDFPSGVAVDGAGNIFISETSGNHIRVVYEGGATVAALIAATNSGEVATTGDIYTVAGTPVSGVGTACSPAGSSCGDGGVATSANLDAPFPVATDSVGNIYIGDRADNRIRVVYAGGTQLASLIALESGDTAVVGDIYTLAGTGTAGYNSDRVLASSAELSAPYGLTVDSAGDLYIADNGNQRIREVNGATGIITTVAGTGTACTSASDQLATAPCGDGGLATAATIRLPGGVAVDSADNLYFSDDGDQRVRKVNATVGSVVFPPTPVGSTSAAVTIPFTVNTPGITITGISAPVSQGGKQEYAISGPASPSSPGAGTIYDETVTFTPGYSGERPVPLQVTTNSGTFSIGMTGIGTGPQVALTPGKITAVAGNGTACSIPTAVCGDGGLATGANLSSPSGLAVDSAGDLYIADTSDQRIREVSAATGEITTMAGNGTAGYSGDGAAASSAELSSPRGVAVDSAGNVYIADEGNNVIREVNSADSITTAVGTGAACSNTTSTTAPCGDGGAAAGAELNSPSGVAVDDAGNVYIADTSDNRIRKVSNATGAIATVAGDGAAGYSGDGGAASSAELSSPRGVAVDSAGNVYIADEGNDVVREVNSAGIITTVAGTAGTVCSASTAACGDGGAATGAQLNGSFGVAVDGAGNLYIADTSDNRIRKVSSATGTIATAAGDGTACSAPTAACGNNGTATGAEMDAPGGVGLDSAGNLYIADTGNQSIRQVNVLASALVFEGTAVGVTSADSPQTAVVSNIGNAGLTFSVPSAGENPSISTNFGYDAASTCPQLSSSSSSSTLAAGADCTLAIDFTPTVSGSISGAASITDDALNVASSIQMIDLSSGAISTTTTVDEGTPIYGETVVTAAVTPGLPAGSVVFTVDGVAQGAVTLNSVGVATLPAAVSTALVAGSHTITAVYTSSSPSSFSNSTGSSTFTVAKASTALTLSASASSVDLGASVTLTATAVSATSGTPPTGTVTFYANSVSIGSGTLSGGVAMLMLTTLPVGTDTITAAYGGDTNFNGSTAAGYAVMVLPPNFALTAGPSSQVVGPGGTVVYTLSLLGENGFNGAVAFTAAGLPPGATVSFNPASVTVTGGTGTASMTVVASSAEAQLMPGGSSRPGGSSLIRYGLLLLAVPLLGVGDLRKRLGILPRTALLAVLGLLSLGAAGLTGCGKDYDAPPPASYTITATGASGSLQQSATVTLIVE